MQYRFIFYALKVNSRKFQMMKPPMKKRRYPKSLNLRHHCGVDGGMCSDEGEIPLFDEPTPTGH
jgi:hypothetical protein